MQAESLGKLLPQILIPYAQQWAERSGMTLLSKLLVDEQLRELIERYSGEFVTNLSQAGSTPADDNEGGNVEKPASFTEAQDRNVSAIANTDSGDMTELRARVLAMEAQHEVHRILLETLRAKMRPLALALGCCPECLVGVVGCPRCWGRSKVAHYPPDYALLEMQVVSPLVTRGVPLTLRATAEPELGSVETRNYQPQQDRGEDHGRRNDA